LGPLSKGGEIPPLDLARAYEPQRHMPGPGTDREADHEAAALGLFRRAVVGQDEAAWAALIARFGGQVRIWVRQHPCWPAVRNQGDDQHWVSLTFERFWQAMRLRGVERFPTLAALLAYLKLCAHSALLDEVRLLRAAQVEALRNGYEGARDEAANVEALALDRLAGRELWQVVAHALSPDERQVIFDSFAMGLKPREIARCEPQRFASAADVYRVKRTALDRLRRQAGKKTEALEPPV